MGQVVLVVHMESMNIWAAKELVSFVDRNRMAPGVLAAHMEGMSMAMDLGVYFVDHNRMGQVVLVVHMEGMKNKI